jgi:hypothetical protein
MNRSPSAGRSAAAALTAAAAAAAIVLVAPAASVAATPVSHAPNFEPPNRMVACGLARVPGTRTDPGTGATLRGTWPGLQCSAPGLHRVPHGIGDPFVQLGQGSVRARVVDLSQDDLLSGRAPARLAAGTVWRRDGISCRISATSVSCTNGSGHGFALARGHFTRT